MGAGRVFCVALPFALTLASLIAMLVAGLSGVTDKNKFLFSVNTTNLSISASSITNLLSDRSLGFEARDDVASTIEQYTGVDVSGSDLYASATSAAAAAATATSVADAASAISGALSGTNITADDLGLADEYYVSLWGYCQTISSGGKECKQSQFNWASNTTQSLQNRLDSVASASGENITIPDAIKDGMSTFSTVIRWTEIVFIIAYVALGVELLLGIFANFSRIISCCTWIVALFAAVAVCAAAALATATASVVVGLVEGTAKAYGVTASISTQFLTAVWVGAAFAIAAAICWLWTVCCCKPDRHSSRGKDRGLGVFRGHKDADSMKSPMTSTPYTPLSGSSGFDDNRVQTGHMSSYSPAYPPDYSRDSRYSQPGAYDMSGARQGPHEPFRHQHV